MGRLWYACGVGGWYRGSAMHDAEIMYAVTKISDFNVGEDTGSNPDFIKWLYDYIC